MLQQQQKVASDKSLVAQEVIRLARLCCNSAHELQNLSVPPKGSYRTCPDAHKMMEHIDKVAGKCENHSRSIMVMAHRWHITGRRAPTDKIDKCATFLLEAVGRCKRLLQQAGGSEMVPVREYDLSLARVEQIAHMLKHAKTYGPKFERMRASDTYKGA